jgi:integrase
MTPGRKSFSTAENHRLLFKRYIEPRWGHFRLSAIRTVEVEEWLHSLPLAPASKAKLKCILSVLYNHAIRYEWLTFNPISRVRASQKRLRDKDVLAPDEFQRLVRNLSVRDRAMVLLIGSTGLRRSEMIALTWSDLDFRTMEVSVLRSCVRNRIGKTKTESSCRPVPLHPVVLSALLEWRKRSPYASDLDSLFPSIWHKGKKPLSPDSILEKSIRPALAREGIVGKRIGWHSFRHSLATNLRSLGVDIKVAQELLRHSSCRTTLDIYTRAVDRQKREASVKVVELMLPLEMRKFRHPSAPSKERRNPATVGKYKLRKGLLVDLVGIEPTTSSMPYTYKPAQPAKTDQSALFAGKMRAKPNQVASGLVVWNQPQKFFAIVVGIYPSCISESRYLGWREGSY